MWQTRWMGTTIATARARARAEVRAEIIAEARRQLAVEGAPALSLRSVTRQLGMASSAVYRYFPSRDDLLTALIVEAYDGLGGVAETAAASGGQAFERWRTVCRAIRGWALENPHEYALIFGSPVPGYEAPALTVGPASRVTLVLAGLLVDAYRAGELTAVDAGPLSRAMSAEARRLADLALTDVPLAAVAGGLVAWTSLFGQISFELFGQLKGVVEQPEVLFEHAITVTAGLLGLRPGQLPGPVAAQTEP
jgi:AcrR family transcriptional regulator